MQGIKCNCGKTIKPGFQIAKNKIKLVGAQSNILMSSAGNSHTNLHSSTSELKTYNISAPGNTPYVSQNVNFNNAARDTFGPKSHEVRTKNLYIKDRKQRFSGDNLQFSNNKKFAKKGIVGLIVKNTNNSAYTRAEKLLNYPMIDAGNSQNFSAANQPQTVVRDLFGYTKVVVMPAINNHGSSVNSNYDVTAKDANFETSSQIGEILKDAHTQNRVADNVMNFFRYKDSEIKNNPGIVSSQNNNLMLMEPHSVYADNTYTAMTTNLNSANNSISHVMTKLPSATVGMHGTLQGLAAFDIFSNTQASM